MAVDPNLNVHVEDTSFAGRTDVRLQHLELDMAEVRQDVKYLRMKWDQRDGAEASEQRTRMTITAIISMIVSSGSTFILKTFKII